MAVEVLGLMDVCQVLVVSKDLYREGGTVEVVPPGLQGVDNDEEFSVTDIVVAFGWDK